jgi:hypothetical protein
LLRLKCWKMYASYGSTTLRLLEAGRHAMSVLAGRWTGMVCVVAGSRESHSALMLRSPSNAARRHQHAVVLAQRAGDEDEAARHAG